MQENKETELLQKKKLTILFTLKAKTLVQKLKHKFPPAADEGSSTNALNTHELMKILFNHDNTIDFELINIVEILETEGYKNEAIEEDGKIEFKWLIE